MGFNRTTIAKGFLYRLDSVGVKKAVKELAAFLVDQRLHGQLEDILIDISKEYARVYGVIDAEARTAYPLSDSLKKELIERVKQSTGAKKIILHEEIDKSLLGGVIVKTSESELDLSLKSKLTKLKA